MNKFVEYLAISLGGLSLFAVCFIGFALMSGKSLSDIPGFGGVMDEPLQFDATAAADDPIADPKQTAPRPKDAVIRAGIGVMGAWNLPSPYSQAELKALTDELKGKLAQLDAREKSLAEREHEVNQKSLDLADRFEMLEQMRDRFEEFESELELREQEVMRSERAAQERADARWAEMGKVLSALESEIAAQRLTDYEPDDAAKILRSMEPKKATEILNATGTRWKEYLDAFTDAAPVDRRP